MKENNMKNILRRIANNHAVSFKIEAHSWDYEGGVIITGYDKENMRTDHIKLPRKQLEDVAHPEILLATVLEAMLDQLEEEKDDG
jgi:hypothetical protein